MVTVTPAPEAPEWGPIRFYMKDGYAVAEGFFDQFAGRRFLRFAIENDLKGRWLVINSPGGFTGAALATGMLARQMNMNVMVGKTLENGKIGPGECSSMCPFVLKAGVKRDVVEGSKLRLHALSVFGTRQDDEHQFGPDLIWSVQVQIVVIVRYLEELKENSSLLWLAVQTPGGTDSMHMMTQDEIKAQGFIRLSKVEKRVSKRKRV